MAQRFYCDGCEAETDGETYIIAVMRPAEVAAAFKGIHSEKNKLENAHPYHLCSKCHAWMEKQTNPTNWPRAAKVA